MTPTQVRVAGILFWATAISSLLAFLMGLVAFHAAGSWWENAAAQGPEAIRELRSWAFGSGWDLAYGYLIFFGPLVVGVLIMLATAVYLLGRLYWPALRERFPPLLYFGLLFGALPIVWTVLHGFWELPFLELILIVPGLFWRLFLQIDLERYLGAEESAEPAPASERE